MESFQLGLRNCGRCRFWGATLYLQTGTYERHPSSTPVYSNPEGVAELFCTVGASLAHDRKLNPDYTYASDKCSKWERA